MLRPKVLTPLKNLFPPLDLPALTISLEARDPYFIASGRSMAPPRMGRMEFEQINRRGKRMNRMNFMINYCSGYKGGEFNGLINKKCEDENTGAS